MRFQCLICNEILELPADHTLSLRELQTIPPKEMVECLAHLSKEPLAPQEADFIWQSIVTTYAGVGNIPEKVLMILHYVTVAVKPEDYANMTLSNIEVIENFGLDYNLEQAQMSAIAERVREDFAGKEPEDYTYYDLVAMKQILCQFNRSEIERIHPSAYREAASTLGKLNNCGTEAMAGFATLAVQKSAFGPPNGWTLSTVDLLGKMTTASVLLTVSTSWNVCDKVDKECITRTVTKIAADAAKELRETPATRAEGLRLMREWIQQNCDVKNVRQDEEFLLRFLRQKKYSIPMAQQTLLKYIAVSPVRDSKGRRVIVYNMSHFNAAKYNCWDMCRAHFLVYESLLDDSMDQMCGFTHVGNGGGVTGAHITSWNPTDFARLLKHKEFHLMNIPATIKYIIDFATSKVTPKMAERLHIYTNLKQLHKNLDEACLPKEYGGHMLFKDMVRYTQQILKEKRQVLLDLDKMEILSTKGIVSSRRSNALKPDSVSVEGSFRKLEID
ncbi:Cellular retinaldehyde binding protein [Operophtera brumata]|uniref:Cellular retinaldehyde binding protein n=1 Tax=Operophtera brumata TaxID=104452 RepID=A0A0L7LV34_OPEBR|nr:Cellular retinaldehyde binding protein [Operophtera brumata]